jgi:transcriptional regulator with XRE-family HTH domain
MENGTVKSRLIEYLESKHLSKSDFSRKIGVSASFVTSIRKSIQPDKIKSIALYFPELNIDWLLTGEGNMEKENKERSTNNLLIEELRDNFSKKEERFLSIIESQQRTIESMQREKEKMAALMGGHATFAAASGSDVG